MTQIATTIEQSNRLLKAGLDPLSSDMWWHIVQPMRIEGCKLVPYSESYTTLQLYKAEELFLGSFENIPAWSLSRLWDILSGSILGGWYSLGSSESSADLIESLVKIIEQRNYDSKQSK